MRRLLLGAVFILLSCAAAAAQDAAVPPLERLIDTDYSVRLPVHPCTVPGTLAGLARRFHFRAGVEYLPVDCQPYRRHWARNGESTNLRGLTIGAALQKLSALDPRYRWVETDGVIVMRPVEAWADPKNLLNYTAGSFELKDVNFGGALDAVVSALTGEQHSTAASLAERTEQGARRFNVRARATSVVAALDAIVRQHGDAWWEVRLGVFQQKRLVPMIWIYTHDGSGMGKSAVRLR
jgi:hypothetical protein